MTTIQNKTFDEERALYAAQNVLAEDCAFALPAIPGRCSAWSTCMRMFGMMNLR